METRSSCCMKARRLNGCLRLKGDVSYRKEGGEEGGQGGKGRGGGEVGWKGERGGGGGKRGRRGREGRKGTDVYNGKLLLHVILIIGNYCKTEKARTNSYKT